MSAAAWMTLVQESTQRERQAEYNRQVVLARLLLGETMTVLGRSVRVTGLDWPDGEPPDWRAYMRFISDRDA